MKDIDWFYVISTVVCGGILLDVADGYVSLMTAFIIALACIATMYVSINRIIKKDGDNE